MKNRNLHRSALSIAMGLCLAALTPVAMAQDGAVVGVSEAGAQVTVRNPQTGFSRTGRLFGLHAPATEPMIHSAQGALVLDVVLDGMALARGVHAAVDAEVGAIFEPERRQKSE